MKLPLPSFESLRLIVSLSKSKPVLVEIHSAENQTSDVLIFLM